MPEDIQVGDKVIVTKPDPESGVSTILSAERFILNVIKVNGKDVYIDTSRIFGLGPVSMLWKEELTKLPKENI